VRRSTTKHSNVDAMSQLLLPDKPKTTPVLAELVLMIEKLDEAPISAKKMATWTHRDVVLSKVYDIKNIALLGVQDFYIVHLVV